MKITFRPAERYPQASDYLFIAGLWLYLLILLAATFAPESAIPRCNFKHWTGMACGGCGTFRGLSHLVAGDFASALRSQPLMIGAYLVLWAYAIHLLIAYAFRAPLLCVNGWSRRNTWWLVAILLTLFFSNWGFLIWDGR